MDSELNPMPAFKALETYFIDNRARLLEIAAFLDRIDRYEGGDAARKDFRYRAFMQALQALTDGKHDRAIEVQMIFSDPTTEPIESAIGLKAHGAFEETTHEGD